MPYTGLNSYSPLSAYQGTVINTDILDSYERNIKPFECYFTITSSSTGNLRLICDDSSFSLKKGTRIIATFAQIPSASYENLRARNIYVNNIGPYPIVTNGAWADDKIPLNSSSRFELTFNGVGWELANNLLSVRDGKTTSMYFVRDFEEEDWFNEDLHGPVGGLKTIPQTKITYDLGGNSIRSGETVGRLVAYKTYGFPIMIPGFTAAEFYGTVSDVAYIQGVTYLVRSEWDQAAADPAASAVTSLWKATDGINFTRVATISTGVDWEHGDLKYNGTYWVFFPHSSDNYFYYSTNGTTWTRRTGPGQYYCKLSVANGRFYVTNMNTTSSTAYYCTNPTSWSSCSLPTTGFWTNITYLYDYFSSAWRYVAYGGSAQTTTASTYVAFSSSGTGSWTNTNIGSYGPVMCIQGPTNYDDSTLTTADLLSIKILCGAGYYGYAYPSSGSISSTIYHYFDTIVSYAINEGSALQDYGNDFRTLGVISDQIVVQIQGSGPNIQHATTRHRYTYKNEYLVSGELSICGSGQGLNISKVFTGQYMGTGLYGSSNRCKITLPFYAKFGIIRQSNSNFYICFAVHPTPDAQSYNTTGITQKMQYGYNSFQTLTMRWYKTYVDWYNASSAAYQLNTSGALYNYVFFG